MLPLEIFLMEDFASEPENHSFRLQVTLLFVDFNSQELDVPAQLIHPKKLWWERIGSPIKH